MNEIVRINIEKIVFGGSGMGHIDGKVCFVPFVIPGEEVDVVIRENKKDYYAAECKEIIAPARTRASARCPYFGKCGGCHYQHMPYDLQIKTKHEQLEEVFRRIYGTFDFPIGMPVSSPDPFFYRIDIKLSRDSGGKDFKYGMIGVDQKTVIPIEKCFIAHDVINQAIIKLPGQKHFNSKKVGLKTSGFGDVSYWPGEAKKLTADVGGCKFSYDARTFFQVNLGILDLIIKELAGSEEISEKAGCLFDLYSGVGVFSIALEPYFQKVVSVEENKRAVNYFRGNIGRNKKQDGKFVILRKKVEDVFWYTFDKEKLAGNVIFLDPPRIGVPESLIKEINERVGNIQSLVYLSCHPPTLARDLKRLIQGGAWKVERIVPFDMFAQTKHIECLAFVERQ